MTHGHDSSLVQIRRGIDKALVINGTPFFRRGIDEGHVTAAGTVWRLGAPSTVTRGNTGDTLVSKRQEVGFFRGGHTFHKGPENPAWRKKLRAPQYLGPESFTPKLSSKELEMLTTPRVAWRHDGFGWVGCTVDETDSHPNAHRASSHGAIGSEREKRKWRATGGTLAVVKTFEGDQVSRMIVRGITKRPGLGSGVDSWVLLSPRAIAEQAHHVRLISLRQRDDASRGQAWAFAVEHGRSLIEHE
ncbi:hypothetical protein HD554DRAFT_2039054 [Boletus coccyginus]|nr:hypothetical protein HD554DRAFT_2039054 [Boletus coccyginus]